MVDSERQHLLEQLVHADEELRRLAVERASLLEATDALPLLVARLADTSWRVRKAAVGRLAALPEHSGSVAALLGAIADGDSPGRRNAALEALVACGRSATLQLLSALASADIDVRKQVVDVLGAIGDSRAEAGLVGALGDADANVRSAAAEALASLGGQASAAALSRLAEEDAEKFVRVAALRALVRLDAEIPLATIEAALADPLLAATGYAALAQCDAPRARGLALKGLLARRASVRDAASRAITALAARADAAGASELVSRLRELAASHAEIAREAVARIDDGDADAKLAAVQFAGLLRTPDAARSLAQCGADVTVASAARAALSELGPNLPPAVAQTWRLLSPASRAFACSALETCGAGDSAERMLRTTLLDASSEVRAAAARALAACASATSLGELLGRLAQEDPNATRDATEDEADALIHAVIQLTEREGSEAADAAIALIDTRLLNHGESARIAAARLLAGLARPADAARVRSLLCDASEIVRRNAVEAVARLGRAGEDLLRIALADEAASVRSAAALAVAQLGHANAEEDLEALAADRDVRVRSAAMSALARRASLPEARELALSLLEAGLRSGGVVALAALAALQRVGGADAARVAALGLHSHEPEIVECAAACVGAHGGEALRDELLVLLEHAAWPVRARAARELAVQRSASAVPPLHARLATETDEFVREALLAALASLES